MQPIDILVLCTGNVCRSPVGERLLQRQLLARGIDARVHSAGFVLDGRPISDESLELLAARGIDAADHRSRVVDASMIAAADLVLGMAREHVREAVLLDRSALSRTFTLRELVRRAEIMGPRQPGHGFAEWLRLAAGDRTPSALLGNSPEDDIEDPMGRRFGIHKKVAAQIDAEVTRLVDLAFPVGVGVG